MKPVNPFLITGYISPDYFCDRYQETTTLLSALENQRNTTLFAARRIGKTGLIFHLSNALKKQKEVSFFYLDIMATATLNEFINQLGKAIIGRMDTKPEQMLSKVGKFFAALRPKITYDPLTGQPNVEFGIETEKEATQTIEQIFAYLQDQNKRVVIAIDEFQQILYYPQSNTEALLRAQIQKLTHVNFIFSGSHTHLLLSMFGNHSRPFYQSTQLMHLEKINSEEYSSFIEKHFNRAGREIKQKHIEDILEWTKGHTFYVQYVCNKLYGNGVKKINTTQMKEVLLSILKENEALYYNYRNLLTDTQWNLLKAIAKEDEVEMPTGKDFIKKYKLSAASSVKTALTALIEKQMVYEEKGKYFVYDIFLARWLERL
jgi:AAA+ ATPase superfamily predicted ATPase